MTRKYKIRKLNIKIKLIKIDLNLSSQLIERHIFRKCSEGVIESGLTCLNIIPIMGRFNTYRFLRIYQRLDIFDA